MDQRAQWVKRGTNSSIHWHNRLNTYIHLISQKHNKEIKFHLEVRNGVCTNQWASIARLMTANVFKYQIIICAFPQSHNGGDIKGKKYISNDIYFSNKIYSAHLFWDLFSIFNVLIIVMKINCLLNLGENVNKTCIMNGN